ncbi:MAG TPA: energy-coupling factor transporter transmembrane protein EcfT [Candidatus Stercoripulliclostridium merdipullorum]|uniref:Energy-coupling factor transporter transmembrane protein EcfT n=1 Tax=Candidatus Stercoripulliclostridium merdipullorum TaxID=2840952 RepID=A0A9D1NDS1_9FIRM|nr:energy-coupling factor transporter transmembrane protein EcfT [Candidatus Stercoripulliclostridium merdipullorum]
MSRDVSFGQYYPAESFVHKLDPRTKLLMVIAYIVGVFLVKDLWGFIPVGMFLLAAILVSRVPLKSILKSLKAVLLIVILTAILNVLFYKEGQVLWSWWRISITVEGLLTALRLALRLVLLVLGTTLLTLTTTPMNLTDGMESLMKPLKYIRVPVHDIALIMSIALRFIPILMEEVDKIMLAQKARGAAFDNGNIFKRAKALLPILIPLFVSALRRAEELALALDARCYNATPNRTKMKRLRFGYRDLIAALLTAVLIVLIVAVNFRFWGLFAPLGWL